MAMAAVETLNVFEELRRLSSIGGDDGAEAIGSLTNKDIDEIRQMHTPPAVVRRTLEATYLLIHASSPSARLVPPTWEKVQRMLSDTNFRQRVLSFDVRTLQATPALTAYVTAEYFSSSDSCDTEDGPSRLSLSAARPSSRGRLSMRRGTVGGSDSLRRAGTDFLKRSATKGGFGRASSKHSISCLEEPLTFQRVSRASEAAAAFFKWSTTVILEAVAPPPAPPVEEMREEPSVAQPEPEVIAATEELVPPPLVDPIAEIEIEATPVVIRARPAQSVINLASPPEPPSPPPRRPVATEPDRHFEMYVPFTMGSARMIEEGEFQLQTIAAAWCMRTKLRLRLEGSPARIENDALAQARMQTVHEWLRNNGVRGDQIDMSTKLRDLPSNAEPGVVCELRLDDDRVLRDFYLLVADGMSRTDAGTKDTLNFDKLLEETFSLSMH